MTPIVVEVDILECGKYDLKGERATLDLYRMQGADWATLTPAVGSSPLTWHVKSLKRDGTTLTIQGPHTLWKFTVRKPVDPDHDLNDPRR